MAWGCVPFGLIRLSSIPLRSLTAVTHRLLGETLERQSQYPAPAGNADDPHATLHRYLIKTGNRDWAAPDFRIALSKNTPAVSQPEAIMWCYSAAVTAMLTAGLWGCAKTMKR